MTGPIARNLSSARRLLSAAIIGLVAIGGTACGDDNGTGPANVEGTYSLRTAAGFSIPASFTNGVSSLDIRSGSLLLEDGLFEATVNIVLDGVAETLTTDGSYDRNGDEIEFEGIDQDGIDVSLVGDLDGNTISIIDPETGLRLEFRKI
ncbi:MAG: hypothetical protein H7Z74_09945 [Anaerolineae bacterium]|nr:hypothetical protein [Gemmatimonadaceae bacterium]